MPHFGEICPLHTFLSTTDDAMTNQAVSSPGHELKSRNKDEAPHELHGHGALRPVPSSACRPK